MSDQVGFVGRVNHQFGRFLLEITEIGGTTYTLTNDDIGKQLSFINDNPITLILSPGLAEGFNCGITQNGAGQITFTESGGSVLANANGHTATRTYLSVCWLYSQDGTGYVLCGDTA